MHSPRNEALQQIYPSHVNCYTDGVAWACSDLYIGKKMGMEEIGGKTKGQGLRHKYYLQIGEKGFLFGRKHL